MSNVTQTTKAPKPVGMYPHARRVGNLLFLSGIGPRDPATDSIPGNEYFADGRVRRYDIGMQAKAVVIPSIPQCTSARSRSAWAMR